MNEIILIIGLFLCCYWIRRNIRKKKLMLMLRKDIRKLIDVDKAIGLNTPSFILDQRKVLND